MTDFKTSYQDNDLTDRHARAQSFVIDIPRKINLKRVQSIFEPACNYDNVDDDDNKDDDFDDNDCDHDYDRDDGKRRNEIDGEVEVAGRGGGRGGGLGGVGEDGVSKVL